MPIDPGKVKRLRGTYGQAEIARRAGMSPQEWNNLESGRKANPTLKKLEQMARALRCRIDDLVTPDDET